MSSRPLQKSTHETCPKPRKEHLLCTLFRCSLFINLDGLLLCSIGGAEKALSMVEVHILDSLLSPPYHGFTGWPIVDNRWMHSSLKKILCLYLFVHLSHFHPWLGRSTKANRSRWVYETGMGPNEKSLNKIFVFRRKRISFLGILPHLYVCKHWAQFLNKILISYTLKSLSYPK